MYGPCQLLRKAIVVSLQFGYVTVSQIKMCQHEVIRLCSVSCEGIEIRLRTTDTNSLVQKCSLHEFIPIPIPIRLKIQTATSLRPKGQHRHENISCNEARDNRENREALFFDNTRLSRNDFKSSHKDERPRGDTNKYCRS